jgi:hypothetical protein
MRASFKFTLRNAKLFFRRDFAQMQTNAPVFAKNDIIWQPCRELIYLAAHFLHKVAKCWPIVIDLREFNARFLPKRFMTRDFSELCLASSEQLDYFISAAACHWLIKPRYASVCNRPYSKPVPASIHKRIWGPPVILAFGKFISCISYTRAGKDSGKLPGMTELAEIQMRVWHAFAGSPADKLVKR